ncbi:kinase-like domain-containing protein, partial [Phlyctochytrium arcticum]
AGYVLGRAPECDVVFDDPHHLTSKRHCLIYQDYRFIEATHRMETNPYIEDMSTNGMTVRDLPLEKNVEYRLQHGDQQNLPDDLAYMFTIPDRVRTNRMSHGLHQRYKMEKSLGSGNFATVKRARDMQTGVFRAITRPKFLENLRTEIAILRTLNHPNIMSLYDAYWESDFVYIVLELVEGGELFDALSKAGRFTEVQAREIMAQLFLALKYLHDRGISHRDLKPENILMVSTDPNDLRIKVSDFGLAKIANASDYMNTLCGTPNYVAPEVLANKQTRKYTCAVDLWSAGVIMYVLLAGYPPFADELGPPEMSEQIRQGKFVFQKQWWGHISGEAKSLIKGLLTVDPSKRLTIDEAMKHPWMQDAF